jgi:membrane-bound lytic murein transglycosylase D
LTDLFDKYRDWLLIDTYNCGPGGVQKAITRSGSRNYWDDKISYRMRQESIGKIHCRISYLERKGSLATITKAESI